ncbi:MAG TPA: NAD-dependent epimerase/dehydratase family protein [Steroidobacteraceae bacterium]|nr:NAD-dependent epimerase/dehydratase family protein [Steroidobacteraceae bacterium]
MDRTRRNVLKAGCGTALALAAGRLAAHAGPHTMLILGGTGFIGPHLTEQAMARGWKVTHFNRGKRDADGVADVETLHGDRKGQLDALKGRKWDAVIDNTGYIPKFVKMSADLLAPNTGYCLFISSISAYASFARPNDEDSATGVLENPEQEEITNETYGPMKALCEQYTRDAWGARCSIVRPGYIVGPLDPTDRFTYYPVRVARGGEMAVPGTPDDPVQIVDVRDLVRFMLDLTERRVNGNFNAVTPPGELTQGKVVESCKRVAGADTKFTWIDEDFLQQFLKPEELRFAPWNPVRGEEAGASLTGIKRSLAEGLRSRPLDEIVRDTLAWHETRPAERKAALRSGLPPEREAELLAAWHARQP